MKVKNTVITILSAVLLCGCTPVDQLFDDAADYTYGIVQKNDKYINAVKTSKINGRNITYEKAFSNFFSYPTWKHFTSDLGVEVVEFEGGCRYDDRDVHALIQFQITNETDSYISWKATYLSLNDVSQPLFMINTIIEKAAEEAAYIREN